MKSLLSFLLLIAILPSYGQWDIHERSSHIGLGTQQGIYRQQDQAIGNSVHEGYLLGYQFNEYSVGQFLRRPLFTQVDVRFGHGKLRSSHHTDLYPQLSMMYGQVSLNYMTPVTFPQQWLWVGPSFQFYGHNQMHSHFGNSSQAYFVFGSIGVASLVRHSFNLFRHSSSIHWQQSLGLAHFNMRQGFSLPYYFRLMGTTLGPQLAYSSSIDWLIAMRKLPHLFLIGYNWQFLRLAESNEIKGAYNQFKLGILLKWK